MSAMIDFARKVLAAQPANTLVGAELTQFEPGRATLELPIRPHHLQQHGVVHGGLVSFMADNALTFAGGSVLGDVMTLEFKINYMRPAKGERLIARARVTGSGRTTAVCHCDLYALEAGAEKHCATAQGTIFKLEGKGG
ncbi:MAG TPA: PaaI family thioesterase [Beijerinckiaceae bacterium]|nr:PaaI family thioesterase [Beijerinckiaceae bacterium]